ncbi:MAG: sugar kinase [Sphingomonadales bacterium]|nr:sugar kinase [Sphingomonadales bacterium]
MKLAAVGSVAFDAIETPFGKTDKIVGGAGTYISLASSFFVKEQSLISVVGGDFPKDFLALLQDKGVNVSGVEIKETEKTFFWSGRYHTDLNSRDTLVTELNVLGDFQPKVPALAQNASFLMLGNLSPAVQLSVIQQMATRPKLIAMDTMNFWMDIALDELKETLKHIDVLIINDEEARQLSGVYSLRKAANIIRAMGPQILIIKKGEHGALLFHEKNVFYAPALPLEEVFDPTGAGDTFAGGFMGYLAAASQLDFETMKRAIIAGSALASFCVEKFGTERLLEISHTDLQQRMQEFVTLSTFQLEA